ncbi:uncharacterized protein F4822DRAFT_439297 [Hypoxylon trugodes]|uniref:uncharacterized protein n=1 Tax=Hypoxylon trugodes TaxID=326681 RepID=UPI00219DEDBA|nr:uncharacterized protein F4822DRAFT_439297 [Hypoxylon trugodes]KAI1382602.1 hypothetical protein F4822DRAFT_439297 [Hypoxylon trugodes]
MDKIASSQQQQPSSPQGSPAPLCIPALRRTGSLPSETGQKPVSDYESGKVTSHASPSRVEFPSLPSSLRISTLSPTRPEEITDPHDLASGDNGRQEPPKVKWKLRPRTAALAKNRRSPSKSSFDSNDEDTSDGDYTGRRKRRRNPPGSKMPNKRHYRSSGFERSPGPHSISTPPSSQIHSDEEDIPGTPTAAFEEWPLQGAVLKRVTVGNYTIFQLQFTCPSVSRGACSCTNRNREDRPSTGTELSMEQGMLRTVGSEAEGSIQDCNEEYAVEQIRGHKFTKPGNKGLQLHVKWRNFQKLTWEPVELMEGTEAYDTYLKGNDISRPSKTCKRGRPKKPNIMDQEKLQISLS